MPLYHQQRIQFSLDVDQITSALWHTIRTSEKNRDFVHENEFYQRALVVTFDAKAAWYGYLKDGNRLSRYQQKNSHRFIQFLFYGHTTVLARAVNTYDEAENLTDNLDSWEMLASHDSCWRDHARFVRQIESLLINEVFGHVPENEQSLMSPPTLNIYPSSFDFFQTIYIVDGAEKDEEKIAGRMSGGYVRCLKKVIYEKQRLQMKEKQ